MAKILRFAQSDIPGEESSLLDLVAYWPNRCGEYMVPIIVDRIEGNPAPDQMRVDHGVIGWSNFFDAYPDYK